MARDAADCVAAGAAEVHLHSRGSDGTESLAPAAVDATVLALRRSCPGTLIGLSTGAWIEGNAYRTLTCIGRWGELPDYASVNLAEPDAPAVMERLSQRRIGVEAGLASIADAERLAGLASAFPPVSHSDRNRRAGSESGVDRGRRYRKRVAPCRATPTHAASRVRQHGVAAGGPGSRAPLLDPRWTRGWQPIAGWRRSIRQPRSGFRCNRSDDRSSIKSRRAIDRRLKPGNSGTGNMRVTELLVHRRSASSN